MSVKTQNIAGIRCVCMDGYILYASAYWAGLDAIGNVVMFSKKREKMCPISGFRSRGMQCWFLHTDKGKVKVKMDKVREFIQRNLAGDCVSVDKDAPAQKQQYLVCQVLPACKLQSVALRTSESAARAVAETLAKSHAGSVFKVLQVLGQVQAGGAVWS